MNYFDTWTLLTVIKICQGLDLNPGSLNSRTTTQPTEPQPKDL